MTAFRPLSATRFNRAALAVLCAAAVARAVLGLLMPVTARDGVTFCWYARGLAETGWEYLRTPEADQHPLFPLLIAGVHVGVVAAGAPDNPFSWQYSGQLVAWVSGLGVIVLAGMLTRRLVARLALPLDERWAALLAMLLTALLPLNMWLGSDVMSEPLHLMFYLGAVLLLVQPPTLARLVAAGLLSGLAFLTRQEGFVPVLAGLAVLWRSRALLPTGHLLRAAVGLAAGFLVCAVPYWLVIGDFSSKKNLDDMTAVQGQQLARGFEPDSDYAGSPRHWGAGGGGDELRGRRGAAVHAVVLGKLETKDHPWYALLPVVLYQLMRAGRVVVPLLAVLPIFNLRRRLLEAGVVPLSTCFVVQLGLGVLVLGRYGYLDPRHLLVPVMLLVPLAAMFLTRVLMLVGPRAGIAVVGVCVLPLALYSLRVPNAQDGYLADTARWLVAKDPQIGSARIVSGSSAKRVAFYTGSRWEYWPEQPEFYAALCRQLKAGGPGWLLLETGTDYERAGNAELLAKLRADPQMARWVGAVYERGSPEKGGDGRQVWAIRLVR